MYSPYISLERQKVSGKKFSPRSRPPRSYQNVASFHGFRVALRDMRCCGGSLEDKGLPAPAAARTVWRNDVVKLASAGPEAISPQSSVLSPQSPLLEVVELSLDRDTASNAGGRTKIAVLCSAEEL